jgi:hypothetical protein
VEKGGGRGGRGRGRGEKGRRGGTREKQTPAAGVFSRKRARAVEDVEALRGLLQEHYHDVPVPVREKRQQRTIPFEEERQRLAFRQRIGPAGHEVHPVLPPRHLSLPHLLRVRCGVWCSVLSVCSCVSCRVSCMCAPLLRVIHM